MTPRKAIIAVLILFLFTILALGFLYLKQQLTAGPESGLVNFGAVRPEEQSEVSPSSAAIEASVNKIIEDAKKSPAQNPPDRVRQEIISTINAEIIKQEQNKTPEQQAADLKAQAERQKIIDQINNQVK